MSRKTAVCVLFVFSLVVAGSYSPSHAWLGPTGGPSASSQDSGLRAIAMPVAPDADPDGLTAEAPAFPGTAFFSWVRLLFGALGM